MLFFSGSASGNGLIFAFNFSQPISLRAGKNEIALLSMTVGLQVSIVLVTSLQIRSSTAMLLLCYTILLRHFPVPMPYSRILTISVITHIPAPDSYLQNKGYLKMFSHLVLKLFCWWKQLSFVDDKIGGVESRVLTFKYLNHWSFQCTLMFPALDSYLQNIG